MDLTVFFLRIYLNNYIFRCAIPHSISGLGGNGSIYWQKTSELEKAGECFSLAGNYELAAQVYGSGNFFRECLSACSKGNHFGIAFEYIGKWKEQPSSNSATKAMPVEIAIIVQEFLEDCARKSHKAKDNASLMKCVRAFSSTESKRKFLISLGCFEELLNLEGELGNFYEASEIAKSLGDTLREEILKKAGQLSKACSLMFSYVISNCLWGSGPSGNQGWPLKSFPQKVELLNTVMSIGQDVSETFHASVCAQAKILLYDQKNLSELMQLYNSSKQYKTLIGEIIVLRKLLDEHFKVNVAKYEWDKDLQLDPRTFGQRMEDNQVSIGALVYLWNLWKEKSLEILKCLENLEKTDSIKLEGVLGFCFNFFGLRLLDDSSVTCHLLNPDAEWTKDVEGYIQRNKNVATLEAHHFASGARKFWHQEVVVLGLAVLEALQRLLSSPMKRSPLYCQSMCLLHIFDIAKFLSDSQPIKMKHLDRKNLLKFQSLYLKYFDVVFASDPRESLSGDMISLRETELSSNLLVECAYRDIGGVGKLSSGQIGRAVMAFLGCGKLKDDLYDKFAARLPDGNNWKEFVKHLREICESPLRCTSADMSRDLRYALAETFSISWKTPGYISLPCFLYLLERLETLVSYSGELFYTRRSTFVECLVPLLPEANPRTGLGKQSKTEAKRVPVDFVIPVVTKLLDSGSRIETVNWIQRFGLKSSYIRVLVLRLLMLVCLFTVHGDMKTNFLHEKMKQDDIVCELPIGFSKALKLITNNARTIRLAVATAFRLVGDPLLIVVSGDLNVDFQCPNAVTLDLKSFSSKTDILTALFPRSIGPSHDTFPVIINVAEASEIAADIMSSEKTNWKLLWNVSDALSLGKAEYLKELHLGNEVEVEEHIKLVASSIEIMFPDAQLVKDLKTLPSLLSKSENDNDEHFKKIVAKMEMMVTLEEWRKSMADIHFKRTGLYINDYFVQAEGSKGNKGNKNKNKKKGGKKKG